MSIAHRLHYYNRIASAYLTTQDSHLTFWHDIPRENPRAPFGSLGEYYMGFPQKAAYHEHLDAAGIPMLDYRGRIGLQYNPIAISQWGLGNYNLFHERKSEDQLPSTDNREHRRKFLAASDWLCSHLQQNRFGIWVWNHLFDWEYRDTLKAPWYSGLAQGQGISLLARAHAETGDPKYIDAAQCAFSSFLIPVTDGGVVFVDEQQNFWFEEYIVSPPTHILNGFIWSLWGVRDYFLATADVAADKLFERGLETLHANLHRYDLGFWSLYEQSGTRLPMIASPFYHHLHIVQLGVMYRMTGEELFAEYAERWKTYTQHWFNRTRAVFYKSIFKIFYY